MSEYKCNVRRGSNGEMSFVSERASWWPEELEWRNKANREFEERENQNGRQ